MIARPRPHGLLLILLSGLVFIPSMSLTEFKHYTDQARGWSAVGFQAVLYAVLFGIFIVPITALILFLIRRKQLSPRWRTLIVISPVLILSLLQFGGSVARPLKSQERFAKMMDCELPPQATVFKAWHSGGGLIDFLDMYHFKTTPEGIDQLLASRPYKPDASVVMTDPEFRIHHELPVIGVSPPEGWPKPRDWPGLEIYRYEKKTWFYYILTDGEKSQAFVIAGCT